MIASDAKPAFLLRALRGQAEVVSEATSLLARVENLMQESEKIAAAAKLEKNWPQPDKIDRVPRFRRHLLL